MSQHWRGHDYLTARQDLIGVEEAVCALQARWPARNIIYWFHLVDQSLIEASLFAVSRDRYATASIGTQSHSSFQHLFLQQVLHLLLALSHYQRHFQYILTPSLPSTSSQSLFERGFASIVGSVCQQMHSQGSPLLQWLLLPTQPPLVVVDLVPPLLHHS